MSPPTRWVAVALALLYFPAAHAAEGDAIVAPWAPVTAWHLSPSDPDEVGARVRLALGAGFASNPLRMSAHEQRRFQLSASGARLSSPSQPWPTDTIAGVPLEATIAGGWTGEIAGAATSITASWDGSVLLRSPGVGDHPLRVQLGAVLRPSDGPWRGGIAGPGEVWATLAAIGDPHAYDRPLPVPDPSLHDPLPDTWEVGVQRSVGAEVGGGWVITDGLAVGPRARATAVTYPRALRNWSASTWDVGANVRWAPTQALYLEARGGYASESAAGDDPGTEQKELNPSWRGSRWGVDVGLDTSRLDAAPLRLAVGADLVQRSFRTADAGAITHHGRHDVGVRATATGAYAPDLEWPWGMRLGVSLGYTLDWNHTSLHPAIVPPDASDFINHTALITTHLGWGQGARPR